MSEELERAKARIKATAAQEKPKKTPVAKSTASQTLPPAQGETVVTDSTVAKAQKERTKIPSSTFGGFKKGFLFSQPSRKDSSQKLKNKSEIGKPSTSSSDSIPSGEKNKRDTDTSNNSKKDDDNIPFVKPKSEEAARGSGLEFPEVQSAMKESYPFLNTKSNQCV